MRTRRIVANGLALGVVSVLGAATAASDTPDIQPTLAADADAVGIGVDAYIYGYPLVTTELVRRVMTNTATAGERRAPMGRFALARTFPTPQFKDVTAPNADTLSETAWLDLSKEPYVLSIPEAKGRYYLMPMLDAWTNVFQAPGTRTTGTGAQTYAITGPGWKGSLPAGVTQYRSPTNIVWILGRIACTGTPEDYAEVHAMQDRLGLVPLSAYGKPPPGSPPRALVDPGVDMKTAVRDQVENMDAATYFAVMADAMRRNPPVTDDLAMVERMSRVGVIAGQPFDASKLPGVVGVALNPVPKLAQAKITEHVKEAGAMVHGWVVTTKTGDYGTDYLQRATVAAIGLGANRPEDAVDPTSEKDAEGRDYDGSHRYVLHFDKGQAPPVKGFWSLTTYDDRDSFAPNRLNRYALGARDPLKTNADGSVDLYLQKNDPGGSRQANWLPAPAGKFVLMMRLYWPALSPPTILDGSWKPPAVRRVD
jgi:hypothetical protein